MKYYPIQFFQYFILENGKIDAIGAGNHCTRNYCFGNFIKSDPNYHNCRRCSGFIKFPGDRFDIIIPRLSIDRDYVIFDDKSAAIKQSTLVQFIMKLFEQIKYSNDLISNSQQFLLHDIQKIISSSDKFIEKHKRNENIDRSDIDQIIFNNEALRDIVTGAFDLMYEVEPKSRGQSDISHVINRVLRTLNDDTVFKNISIEQDIEQFNLDAQMGFIAILEIIRNALKYSPNNESVFIVGSRGGVRDNFVYKLTFGSIGLLVKDEDFDNVFTPSWRSSFAIGKASGTGQGLTRVVTILEKYLSAKVSFEQKGDVISNGSDHFRSTILTILFY